MKAPAVLIIVLFLFFLSSNADTLYFDDFSDGNDNGWIKPEGGDWRIENGVFHRGLGAYPSTDGHMIAYVGDLSNRDYTVEADVSMIEDTPGGWSVICFRIKDSANYYTFQMETSSNTLKLETRRNHQYTVLAQTSYYCAKNTWYHFKVTLQGDSIKCYVNNVLQISFSDTTYKAGPAGLASWHAHSHYDNFLVTGAGPVSCSLPYFDDFSDGDDNGWLKPEGGDWTVENREYHRGMGAYPSSDGHFISYIGCPAWNDYVVEADVKVIQDVPGGWGAVCFRVQDSANYYTFQFQPSDGAVTLETRTNHAYRILAAGRFHTFRNVWYRLKVILRGDSIYCFINGEKVFSHQNGVYSAGGAGLASWHAHSHFDNFSVTAEYPSGCVDLIPVKSPTLNRRPGLFWHRVAGASSYRIMIDNDSSFSTPIVALPVTDTAFQLMADLPFGMIYWKVKSDLINEYCPMAGFYIQPDTIPFLFAFGGVIVAESRPVFCWRPVSGAAVYRIQIDTVPDFQSPMTSVLVGDTLFVPLSDLKNGKYYWRVSCDLNLTAFSRVDSVFINKTRIEAAKGGARGRALAVYPTPFKPSTTIYLPDMNQPANVVIYSVAGKNVAAFMNLKRGPVVWDASGLPSGIYIVKVNMMHKIFTKRICLLK